MIHQEPLFHELNVIELQQQLADKPDLKIFDVREPEELLAISPIENAINIPLNDVPLRLADFPENESFVVYCKSGRRSQLAVNYLRELGYTCQNLLGGIQAWHQESNCNR